MAVDREYRADSKMEARVSFILMKAGVTGPEIDECMTWAFGPGAWYVPIFPDWVERWHKLHPQFSIKNNEKFVDFIYVVGGLFLAWKNWKAKKEGKINGEKTN